jgi:hypothetical protein
LHRCGACDPVLWFIVLCQAEVAAGQGSGSFFREDMGQVQRRPEVVGTHAPRCGASSARKQLCGMHVTARVRDARNVHDVPTGKVPLQQRGPAGSQPAVPLPDGGGRRMQGTDTTVSAEDTGTSSAAVTGQGVLQARGYHEWGAADAYAACRAMWVRSFSGVCYEPGVCRARLGAMTMPGVVCGVACSLSM